MQWYYTQNGESKGPVREEDLRRMASDGVLKPADHVWNEGMGDQWSRASSIPGLFGDEPAAHQPPAASIPAAHLTGAVSCRAAVSPAWQRMKTMLFRPFSLGKWFTLGVSAWLATLGEGGGSSFSGNANDFRKQQGTTGPGQVDFNEVMEPIREFMSRYGEHVLMIAIALVVVGIALGLFVTWLRARGKFMFLDNVATNRSEISSPWREFSQHGNSLFWWYVLYGLACLLVFAILMGMAFLAVVLPFMRAGTFVRSAIPSIALIGTVWLIVSVIVAYISRFVEDFVIPISYHCDLTIMEAWGKFRTIFRANRGGFVIYGLFYLLLGIAATACIFLFVLATCCVGGCIMAIPYVGTVIMLPVTVFFRAYSLEYLSQYGNEFRVFSDW